MKKDLLFLGMEKALEEAHKGYSFGEIPVGAVAYDNSDWVAGACNEVEQLQKPWAHAELILLEKLHTLYKTKYFPHISIFVTLEPCALCWQALILSRVSYVIFGAYAYKTGKFLTHSIQPQTSFHVIGGVDEINCEKILLKYFHVLRQNS